MGTPLNSGPLSDSGSPIQYGTLTKNKKDPQKGAQLPSLEDYPYAYFWESPGRQ